MDIQTQGLNAEELLNNWASVHPLISEEWSSVDASALQETNGDADKVVSLIAETLDCTQLRVRRHLGELVVLATSQSTEADLVESRVSAMVERFEEKLNPLIEDGTTRLKKAKAAMDSVIDDAQNKANDIRNKVGDEINKHLDTTLPEAEEMIKQNLWSSLLIALGFGVIFGLLWGTRGR